MQQLEIQLHRLQQLQLQENQAPQQHQIGMDLLGPLEQLFLDGLKVHQAVERLLQLLLMVVLMMVMERLIIMVQVGLQEIILIINTTMVEQEELQQTE